MTISEKIALLRERDGLSLTELAEKLEVAKKTLMRWERGELMPDLEKIVRLSEIFSVSTDSLLIDELDPTKDNATTRAPEKRCVSIDEAREFIGAKFRAAYMVAAATFMIMLSPGIMLLIMALPHLSDILGTVLGLASFFLFSTLSVLIYIRSHVKLVRYDYITKGDFVLDYGATDMLMRKAEQTMLSYAVRNTVAIILCIGSLAPLIVIAIFNVTSELIIMSALTSALALAGFGVVMFITSGMKRSAISTLTDTKAVQKDYSKRLEDSITRGFWILVFGFYLLYSYVNHNWHISWVIFIFAVGISNLISAAFTLVRRANGNDSSDGEGNDQ